MIQESAVDVSRSSHDLVMPWIILNPVLLVDFLGLLEACFSGLDHFWILLRLLFFVEDIWWILLARVLLWHNLSILGNVGGGGEYWIVLLSSSSALRLWLKQQ